MAYLNKEHLTPQNERSVDEIALSEVDSYIEKVEKSTERTISDNQGVQDQNSQTQQQSSVLQKQNMGSTGQPGGQKRILLPIDESLLNEGLRSKPTLGIKWLAEWCLMMIKKYPGRVFYSPSSTYD